MFNEIRSRCESYYESYRNQIPSDTWETIAKSAAYSFMVNILIVRGENPTASYNLVRPLVATAISVIASAIYGLTAPLFTSIFGKTERVLVHHEFIKITVVNILTSTIFAYTTAAKINLFAFVWLSMLPLNFFKSGLELLPALAELFEEREVAQSLRSGLEKWGMTTRSNSGSIFIAI